jgi:hypothetical protein
LKNDLFDLANFATAVAVGFEFIEQVGSIFNLAALFHFRFMIF